MIELSYLDLAAIITIAASLTSLVTAPLAIRYGTPDKEEN